MKDYRISKNVRGNYITKIEKGKNDTLEIVLADGRRFKNIEDNEKNIERLNNIMEEQAKDGVRSYVSLKNKEHTSKIKMFLSSTALCAGGFAAMAIPQVHEFASNNPVIFAAGIGTIAVLGSIPAYCGFRRNYTKVRELDKIRYRDSYRDSLDKFKNYHNSLSGLSSDKVKYFEETKEPFSMINIDKFDEADLQQIVGNMQFEDELGVTYKKTKKSNNYA